MKCLLTAAVKTDTYDAVTLLSSIEEQKCVLTMKKL